MKSRKDAKIIEAQEILHTLGLPKEQQNEMSALTLLALAGIGPKSDWKDAVRKSLTVTKGIMIFIASKYGRKYAPNTRETFRRHVLHQFVQAHIADYNPDNPSLPTNSPNAHYALSEGVVSVLREWGTKQKDTVCDSFRQKYGTLCDLYHAQRKTPFVLLKLPNGQTAELSPGRHNELQVAIVKDFGPRFVPGAILVYVGDTAKKNLFLSGEIFQKLGVEISDHNKLPDVVLYDPKKNRLVLIEAVTSHGPMTPKRVVELKELFAPSKAGLIFVSTFPDFAEFRKNLRQIAWDTEVWIAEIPDHMIHYNGDKFLGSR